jgi:diguanylate cyclase (GGDEF)-like protein
MSLLTWFDNRTLFSCQFLLAFVFFIVFFGMRRAHSDLRGIGTIALSFLFGVVGILFLFLRGAIPNVLSTTVANALVLLSFTLQYLAINRFLGIRRSLYPLWAADLAALIVVFYYSQIQHNIVPRIIVASLAIALNRGLTSVQLLRNARGRTHMRLFGLAMMLFAVMSIVRAIVSYSNGAPANYMQSSPFQTLALAGDLLYICLLGLFFFTMISGKVLGLLKDQLEQDPLSGSFNRRGIEQRLDIELKRFARSKEPLSIALIDVDHFKSINDSAGHAAGDAAIREVAAAISAQLRAYDLLGRYGGDEFLLVLPHTACAEAQIVADRIGLAMRALSLTRKGPALTLSIGLSEAVPAEHSSYLLSRADQALYQAKRAGRNCTRTALHNPESATIPDPFLPGFDTPYPDQQPDPFDPGQPHAVLASAHASATPSAS